MAVSQSDQVRVIAAVIKDHMAHDLTESEQEVLRRAAKQFVYCTLGGILIGSTAAARFTFVGKYAPSKLRALPPLYNRRTNSWDQNVARDRLAFFGRGFLLSSIGLVAGTQLGISAGYYMSNRTIDREGARDKLVKAMMAAQNDLKNKLGPTQRSSRMRDLPESAEEVDGENTALSSAWERDQALTTQEQGSEFVDENAKKQRFVPPPRPTSSGGKSRWEELQTGKQGPSAWERIRQENAQGDMQNREQEYQAKNSFDGGEIKGRDYAAEQKAFAALMEKERRGENSSFITEDLGQARRRPSM